MGCGREIIDEHPNFHVSVQERMQSGYQPWAHGDEHTKPVYVN